MRSDMQTVTLAAHWEHAFDFLANPENLPRWAIGFCRAIRREGDGWVVSTGQSEVGLRYVTDRTHGVIDFHMTPVPGVEVVAVSRVVPNGDGAEYVFTQFQAPGTPDEVFEAQRSALRDELHVLRLLLRAQATCPA